MRIKSTSIVRGAAVLVDLKGIPTVAVIGGVARRGQSMVWAAYAPLTGLVSSVVVPVTSKVHVVGMVDPDMISKDETLDLGGDWCMHAVDTGLNCCRACQRHSTPHRNCVLR